MDVFIPILVRISTIFVLIEENIFLAGEFPDPMENVYMGCDIIPKFDETNHKLYFLIFHDHPQTDLIPISLLFATTGK